MGYRYSVHDNGTMLSAQDIYASYGKKEILHGLSLSVRAGEIVALIGPNGAGKSTLLKAVAGVLTPKEGQVLFDGEDVTKLSPYRRVRKGIGYFMQGGEIFPTLSVQENLELGGADLPKESVRNHAEEVLALFPDLRKVEGRRAGLLSGGQRQALALGIILMRKPKLLLLDEPSAGLAPVLVEDLTDRITEVNERMGASVLLVEQNVRQALRISHRVYVLKEGRMIREEKPEVFAEKERLEEIFFG